jgi:hypothetical protein
MYSLLRFCFLHGAHARALSCRTLSHSAARRCRADFWWTTPGSRVFNIFVQGSEVAAGVDLVAQVGPDVAWSATYAARTVNGALQVMLVALADAARLSGVYIAYLGP